MLKNENIICISSIDWDFIWQGHQEIMSALAKNGNRVLFIENTGARMPGFRDLYRIKNRIKNWFSGIGGIRQQEENLFIFSPLVLPFPYLRPAIWINGNLILSVLQKWIKVMNFNNPIVWIFLPTPLSLNVINNLGSKFVIYYCIDNFRVSSVLAKKITHSEIKLLKKADLVFTTSKGLYNYCAGYSPHPHTFPFAVNFRSFEAVRLQKGVIPEDMKALRRPVIGYVGGIHKWVDLPLIKKAAARFSGYSFVFVGPVQTDISALSNIKNIHFLGKKEHQQLPHYINNFDLCLIPYLVSDYTKNVYPTKLNEYLAMGKPVLSTDLPEVVNFNLENNNLVLIAKNPEEFMDFLAGALRETADTLIDKRISAAKKNSWEARIEEMSGLIEEGIAEKNRVPSNWQQSLLKLYRLARRKALNLVCAFIVIYTLLFYTPLVWLLAGPLKISQPPVNADCIVVFAGGVGESGKAGQGYEERVQYAFKLYSQGFARYLIFSSGYTYAFREPLVMKALAVALGISEEAIILEDRSNNTYTNVKFTNEILRAKNWNKILFVSSPYHMRRASLVFHKIAKDIKVQYVPLPESLFYAHKRFDSAGRRIWRQANFQQVKGILHEYLGILYYWINGKI